MGLQKPYSCLDCQCKILSDVYLRMLDAVDWRSLLFLEGYNGKGRPRIHSRIGLLKALLYMELSGIGSVRELVRVLEEDKYKMKILGLDRLPCHSTFSRFKYELGESLDRVMTCLNRMIKEEFPDYMKVVGVDSTKLLAYSYKDADADWGHDHITEEKYYGYKAHILYDLPTLTPLCFTVTPANKHDNTQVKPLLKKHGANTLRMQGFFADRAYDSKDNIRSLLSIGIPMICRRNKRNSRKPQKKYRLQDYVKVHGNKLNCLYKNRMDCEYTNNLLKEHLRLERVNTTGILRTRIKTGLTMIARQIQVLYQVREKANPRTIIIK